MYISVLGERLEEQLGHYQIKVCGITNLEDLKAASAVGVDYAGVLLEVASSFRSVNFSVARELVKFSPLPVLILTDRNEPDWLAFIGKEIAPFGIQFLSSPSSALVRRMRTMFPSCVMWQTFHLPPAGTEGSPETEGSPDEREKSFFTYLEKLEEEVAMAFRAGVQAAVLDTAVQRGAVLQRGGTGRKHDWKLARVLVERAPGPVFLAGGINPDNVRAALSMVNPAGVDLSSGVELVPGKKDISKIQLFVRRVRKLSCP